MLRSGAEAHPTQTTQEASRGAAQWVERFCAPSYGPGGGWKLLAQDARIVSSAAEALQDVPTGTPLAPYRDLARRVHAEAGDQATLALLWSAGIVRRTLDARAGAARLRSTIDGIVLARRQCRAWWQAHAQTGDVPTALAMLADDGPALHDGLARIAQGTHIDLDRIQVRAAPRGEPGWADGVPLDVERPVAAEGKVLLLADAGLKKPRNDLVLRADLGEAMAHEEASVAAALEHIQRLGTVLLVCRKDVPEALAGRLRQAGIQSIGDVGADTARRITWATGAQEQAHWRSAEADAMGDARIRPRHPRHGGALVSGDGPVAAFEVPDGPGSAMRVETAERWLRAAGHVWEHPETLPGGGRWQRDLALALRRSADLAPGRQGLGVATVADALDACADALLRNLGRDPLVERVADEVPDPARCVATAGTAALDLAIDVLRLDGVYRKRPSAAPDLRGGTGPSGSPKGMPGDIPPLM